MPTPGGGFIRFGYPLVKGLNDMEMVYKRLMEIKDEIRKQ